MMVRDFSLTPASWMPGRINITSTELAFDFRRCSIKERGRYEIAFSGAESFDKPGILNNVICKTFEVLLGGHVLL
jgi:hypothetical protein